MIKSCKFKVFIPPLWWQFMNSRHDFLLKVSPNLRYKHKQYDQSYYPPPGYGVPPGSLSHKNSFKPKHRYALFLFPGKIVRSLFLFSFILPFIIFIPLVCTYPDIQFKSSVYIYALCIFSYWLFSYLFYLLLYHHFMPPVLSRVWEKWPVPANHLFLSVPHYVTACSYEKWSEKDEDIYWQPDAKNHMHRQTSEFAPDTQSLQEILLNFAVFEFFFKRPSDKKKNTVDGLQPVEYEKVIKEKEWYCYLFTPIWLNYLLIIISLMILTSLPHALSKTTAESWMPLGNLPYNFVPVIIVWLVFSLIYMSKIISSLSTMHRKIRKGAFDAHLEFVPQAILQELSNIPEPQHIDAGIQHIKRILGWISGIAVLGFLAILEVLTQAYGNQPTFFISGG